MKKRNIKTSDKNEELETGNQINDIRGVERSEQISLNNRDLVGVPFPIKVSEELSEMVSALKRETASKQINSLYESIATGLSKEKDDLKSHPSSKLATDTALDSRQMNNEGLSGENSNRKNRNSLRIKSFKKIQGQVQLNSLGRINYLVGKNGHGKSSILSAISYLNYNESENTSTLIQPGTDIEITLRNFNRRLHINEEIIRKSGKLALIVISLGIESTGHCGAKVSVQRPADPGREEFRSINESIKIADLKEITAERIINNSDPFDDLVGRRVFREGNLEISFPLLSSGVIALNNFNNLLQEAISQEFRNIDYGKNLRTIVIVEEPENNLHPGLQKKIPQLLDHFLAGLNSSAKRDLYIMVSTHSPFIVSSAATFPNQKVYLINDGLLSDEKLNPVAESSGYSGHECAWVVGQMLGGDVTDLGYPENYCILEEYSLQVILDDCKKKGLIKNFQFVSASGASRQISLLDTLKEITNLNTLIKCNPYYFDKYFVIMDSIEGLENAVKERITPLRAKLADRFKELSEDKLETYYKNIDIEIHRSTLNKISLATGRDKGIAKEEGAILISQKIQTREQFSKLFNGELDFLLK